MSSQKRTANLDRILDRILLVCAHADDEVLGAGGTLARHDMMGDAVRMLIVADCRTARDPEAEPALAPAALQAAQVLGAEVRFLGWHGMRLDAGHLLPLIQGIEAELAAFRPSVVYTHHAHDLNSDHQAVSRAVMVATRPFLVCRPTRVLHFEVPSSTGWETPPTFAPNAFVELSKSMLAKKLEAMACYAQELRPAPHPRSFEALRARASYWGQQCGCRYAEPFMLMREVLTAP